MRSFRRFFEFLIVLNFWSHFSYAKEVINADNQLTMDPKLYFDSDDPQWLSWIGQFSKEMSRCSLNTDELNSVRFVPSLSA